MRIRSSRHRHSYDGLWLQTTADAINVPAARTSGEPAPLAMAAPDENWRPGWDHPMRTWQTSDTDTWGG